MSSILQALLSPAPIPDPNRSNQIAAGNIQVAAGADKLKSDRLMRDLLAEQNIDQDGADFDAIAKAALKAGDVGAFKTMMDLKTAGIDATAKQQQSAMKMIPVMAKMALQFPELRDPVARQLAQAGMSVNLSDPKAIQRVANAFDKDLLSDAALRQKSFLQQQGRSNISVNVGAGGSGPPVYTVGDLARQYPGNTALQRLAQEDPNQIVQIDKNGKLSTFKRDALTDAESKGAKFTQTALESLQIMEDIENLNSKAGKMSLTEHVAGSLPLVGDLAQRLIQSEDRQSYESAGSQLVESILRDRTGAAITGFERSDARDMYMPQALDSNARLEMKRKLRSIAVQAMIDNVPANKRVEMLYDHQAMLRSMKGDEKSDGPTIDVKPKNLGPIDPLRSAPPGARWAN